MNQALLLDAALLHNHPWQARLTEPDAVPLYGDLGAQAAAVGPWLLPGGDIEALRGLPLPVRYGATILQWRGERSDAVAHLQAMRTAVLEGGERFYLRYADHRPLQVILALLRPHQRARLLGFFQGWTICDRYDRMIDLAADLSRNTTAASSAPLLHLRESDMDVLQDLQLPERLSAALMELKDSDLQPGLRPAQFQQVEAAAAYIRATGVTGWPLLRAIAVQAVRTRGHALQTPAFLDVVRAASTQADAQRVFDWSSP